MLHVLLRVHSWNCWYTEITWQDAHSFVSSSFVCLKLRNMSMLNACFDPVFESASITPKCLLKSSTCSQKGTDCFGEVHCLSLSIAGAWLCMAVGPVFTCSATSRTFDYASRLLTLSLFRSSDAFKTLRRFLHSRCMLELQNNHIKINK